MRTLAFFNNQGGVGKTTLVYHFAHMLAESGIRVLVVDLDPQSNLTAMCLPEERLEQLWPDTPEHASTVLGCLRPILRGTGDVGEPHIELINERLGLVPGDLGLSRFEDVGPNLGAINRAALLAAQHVVTPLAPDLFSVQGLRNLGPTLADWRRDWKDRLDRRPAGVDLPDGVMNPLGYVLMQAVMRLSRPVRAYERWVSRMPAEYHRSLLRDQASANDAAADPASLGIMKNYQSLMPLAHDAHKPMFALKPADGAIGAHAAAVARCRDDFHALTTTVLRRMDTLEDGSAGAIASPKA